MLQMWMNLQDTVLREGSLWPRPHIHDSVSVTCAEQGNPWRKESDSRFWEKEGWGWQKYPKENEGMLTQYCECTKCLGILHSKMNFVFHELHRESRDHLLSCPLTTTHSGIGGIINSGVNMKNNKKIGMVLSWRHWHGSLKVTGKNNFICRPAVGTKSY